MTMKDVFQIRVENLLRLIDTYKTQEVLQSLTGIASSTFSRIKRWGPGESNPNFKRMGEKLARRVEASLELEPYWMDTPHETPAEPNVTVVRLAVRTSPAPPPNRRQDSGLSSIQAATHDTLVKLMLAGKLSDTACLKLLQSWQSAIEELAALH